MRHPLQHRLLDPAQLSPGESKSQCLGFTTRYHIVRRLRQQRPDNIGDTAGERRHQTRVQPGLLDRVSVDRYPGDVNITCCRNACGIEETETVTITGGWYSMTRVTRYTAEGASETLPSMQNGRRGHACGHYTTSSNSIVHS